MEVQPDGPAGEEISWHHTLGLALNTPQQISPGNPAHLKAAMRARKRDSWWDVQAQGNERASQVGSLLLLAYVGSLSLPGGETPQNHRDQTNANVLFHFSLLSKLSDNLLLRPHHLYNRKTAHGQR